VACSGCGLAALPHHEVCGFCGALLLAPGQVAAKREEWDRLTEKLRSEFSSGYERGLAARIAWRERLRRNRIHHAITGALTFALMVGVLHAAVLDIDGVAVFLLLLAEFGAGAALGLVVNRQGGGGYVGLGAFGGGYLAWTVLSLLTGVIVGPFERGVGGGFLWGAFVLPGSLVAATFGYLFGLNLSMRRSVEE